MIKKVAAVRKAQYIKAANSDPRSSYLRSQNWIARVFIVDGNRILFKDREN